MPIIAIVNQKGGTGKTTLSTNLAWAFAETASVLLLDADPQGSAQDWADSQLQPPLMNLEVKGAEPNRLIQEVRSSAFDYGWVIIDGPPGISRCPASTRFAELPSISFAGSPPLTGPAAVLHQSGSWGRQTRG